MKTFAPRHIEYSKARRNVRISVRTRGFTLIELLIVMAIAAILSALILGGLFQITASNRRSGCQVNMSQIYNALRMYANDYDGAYPYYNDTNTTTIPAGANNGGVNGLPVDTMGLWKLYTTVAPDDLTNVGSQDTTFKLYTTTSAAGTQAKFVGIYLHNITNLHCPNDNAPQLVDDDGLPATPTVPISDDTMFTQNGKRFNPNYLSYQTIDTGTEIYPAPPNTTTPVPTYQTQRTNVVTDTTWNNQLLHYDGATQVFEKRPPADTVILWCKWHRTGLGGRNGDIVLFADGSVKTRPLNAASAGQPQPGWQRTP